MKIDETCGRMQARLVDDWHQFARWWSVRMTIIGGILGAALSAMPAMPPEIQAAVPVKYRVAAIAIWSLASIVTRVVKQKPNAPR